MIKNTENNIMKRALALSMKKGIRDHLDQLNEATRLALDDTLQHSDEIRDEILQLHRAAIENQTAQMKQLMQGQANLIQAMTGLLQSIESKMLTPQKITVPRATVKLEQQPVNVKVDAPVISMPEPSVVIKESKSGIKSARITHSDGSQSTVEFST